MTEQRFKKIEESLTDIKDNHLLHLEKSVRYSQQDIAYIKSGITHIKASTMQANLIGSMFIGLLTLIVGSIMLAYILRVLGFTF